MGSHGITLLNLWLSAGLGSMAIATAIWRLLRPLVQAIRHLIESAERITELEPSMKAVTDRLSEYIVINARTVDAVRAEIQNHVQSGAPHNGD